MKCFTREVSDQEPRYRAISEHLAPLKYDWKVDFEYISQGILVNETWYPILAMEWADAVSMTRWVEAHLNDRAALSRLAERFVTLVGELADAEIGHGDLQHGNLLVTPDGSFRLVDYDGMYVPALAGRTATENGHRNYQSPIRSANDFGPVIDRFSAWVVYLSLFAIAVDPSLWRQLRETDAEQLLLAEEDFRNPASSFRLAMLLGHAEPAVVDLAKRFQDLLNRPLSALPPITAVAPSQPIVTASRNQQGARGLPSWMAGHLAPPTPVAAPLTFARQPTVTRIFGLLSIVLLLLGLVLLAVEPVGIGLVALALSMGGSWLGWTAVAYRRQPETQKASAVRARHAEVAKRMAAASRQLNLLEQRTEQLKQADETRRADQAKRQQQLQQQHNRELAALQGKLPQQIAGIDARLRALTGEKDNAKRTELARAQQNFVSSYLARNPISSAHIKGINTTLITNLRQAGIVTAADFVGVHYSAGQYQSRMAMFELANHNRVKVPGIGEVKAGRLATWRDELVRRARASQPTDLSKAALQAIDHEYAMRSSSLQQQRRQLADQAKALQDGLVAKLNIDRTDLLDQFRRENGAAAHAHADHEQQLSRAKLLYDTVRQESLTSATEASTFHRISYRMFLRSALIGTKQGATGS